MADVLESGPARPGRRRRWPTVAGGLALAAVAAVLAARSAPGPGDPPAPTPEPAVTRAALPTTERSLVDVAVGRRTLYALVSRCDDALVPNCAYRVHRREAYSGRWRPLPWLLPARAETGGAPNLEVTADEVVTVVAKTEPTEVQTSPDDGITVSSRTLTSGPTAAAVPPGALLDPGYCISCGAGLTVFEPLTGRFRTVARQPPLGGLPGGSFDRNGDVIWAVATGPRAGRSAVSTDAGRTWRTVPLDRVPGADPMLQVVAGADGSAWLLTGSFRGGPPQQLAGVQRIDGPGGRWRAVPRSGPETFQSALAGRRGLLVVDVSGAVWRLPPGGRFTQLPDPGPERPGQLVRGPDGRIASVSPDDARGRTVLFSDDEGDSWQVERVF